jgi:hypothetical protein
MAVAFDAVGPSSTGANTATSPLTWTHVCAASATHLLVGATYDLATDTGKTMSATYNSVAMTSLGVWHTGGGTAGFLQVWALASPSTGSNQVSITFTAGASGVNGGSLSFTGSAALSAVQATVSPGGTANPSANFTGAVSGNIVAGFLGCGTAATQTGSFTNRYNCVPSDGAAGAGFSEAATIASSGTVTDSYTMTADFWAIALVEVQVAPIAPIVQPVPYARPGYTWLHHFRCPQFFNQRPPGPVVTQANPITAKATGSALGPQQVITVSAAAAPQFNPGKTWRKHFQWPQQQQLSGPPPICWAPARLAAGTGSASSAAVNPSFPVGLAGGGTGYFIDSTGTPRLAWGDAVWALPGNAGRWNSGNWQADFDGCTANRAAQGFNILYAKPMGTVQSGNIDSNGVTFDGLYPFQGGSPSTGVAGANPSTGLTAAFWARIDYFLTSAYAHGITVFLNAIGYDSDFSAGPGPLFGKSTTEFQAYGAAIGARYAQQLNLIWHLADDYFGENDALIAAFMTGVRSAGDTHLVSIENYPESTSRFDTSNNAVLAWGTSNAQYNFAYSYNCEYFSVEYAYAEASPIPVLYGDGYFYQGGTSYFTTNDRSFRQGAWWALASGARGRIHGSESIWKWDSGSLANSATDWYYANQAGPIRTLVESLINWQLLLPAPGTALVTAGRGTRATGFSSGGGGGQYEPAFTNSYVAASVTPDGSLALLYLPNATTITINESKLATGYKAYWVDPVTCVATLTTSGPTYNSTAQGSNSRGEPDWVLVLQGTTATLPAPQINPGRTWLRRFNNPGYHNQIPPVPAAATNAQAGLASATGKALGQDNDATFDVLISPNAGSAAATGTALGQDTDATFDTLVSPNAAASAGTGTAHGFDTGDALPGVSYPRQQALPGRLWLRIFHPPQYANQFTPLVAPQLFVTAGLAAATGAALGQDNGNNIAFVSPNAAIAAATGAAQAPNPSVAPNAGLPAATGAGQNAAANVQPGAALASASGISLGNDTGANEPSIIVNAATAAGTGSALDASTSVPGPAQTPAYPGAVWRHYFLHPQQVVPPVPAPMVTANAGLASATGTAPGQDTGANIAFVSPNAAVAAATGAAQAPNPSVAPNAGLAAATGAAQNATANVQPNAAIAAATGAALGQDTGANEASVTVFALTASGVGAALDASTTIPAPPPAVAAPGRIWKRFFQHPQQPVPPAPVIITFTNANAGLAAATGTALGQDTGANIAFVSPNAASAPASGTALGQDQGADVAAVSPNAGLASGTGAAAGPNPQVSVNAGLAAGTGAAQNVTPASASAAAATPALPGGTWRKHFQHPQQWRPFVPPPPPVFIPASGTSTVSETNTGIASVSDPRDSLATVSETAGGVASVS